MSAKSKPAERDLSRDYCDVAMTQAHHWLLPQPDGSERLLGICKLCSTARLFPSFVEYGPDWVLAARPSDYVEV